VSCQERKFILRGGVALIKTKFADKSCQELSYSERMLCTLFNVIIHVLITLILRFVVSLETQELW
jgi:hypothetical protein